MIPHPVPLLPPRPRVWPRAPWGPPPPRGSRALPPPFHRNNRAPLPPAPATPEPPFQVENLCGGAQPGPEESLRRQQRDVMTGGAIDFSDLPSISLSLPLACNLSEKHKKRDTLPH